MSAGSSDRLVYMANQIAAFFASQPEGDAGAAVADHLRAYWTPAMREALVRWRAAGGEGLAPAAAEAVRLLERPRGTVRAMLAETGEPTARRPGDDAG